MIVTVDFETYYSLGDYSLSRMSETDYILDPRFQTILCAIKVGSNPTEIHVGHERIAARFATLDWDNTALLSHNMRFDGAIAAWLFHVKPKLYLDTLSMARALTHVHAGGSSLKKVAKYLGLPDKGDAVVRASGKRLEDFAPEELREYADYCVNDCDLCYEIFQRFTKVFPVSELAVVDACLRMFVEPEVKLDQVKLTSHLAAVRALKAVIMAKVAHIDPSVFSSNLKFAALLQIKGVEVPTKLSPATGLETFALAKNDRAFKELCEDEDQSLEVQALLAARLGSKSTIEETRTASLLNLSLRSWGNEQGWCPIPLKYFGAHTGRFSGDGGFNFQNLKRGSPIRAAIVAPDGYRIVHRDASQIEARMVAWLAGCESLLAAFAQGRDVYSEFASRVYGVPVTKADPGRRFVGKTSILGLGYGTAGPRLQHTLFIGNGGISVKVDLDEANRIVWLYRDTYREIPHLWHIADLMLDRMIDLGGPPSVATLIGHAIGTIKPMPAVKITAEAIWLPNGLAIQYPGLHGEMVRKPDGRHQREVFYDGGAGRGATKLYGAKVCENISQALSRIVITDVIRRVQYATGYHPFLSTHDSLDYAVPVADAPAMDALLDTEFAITPSWADTLPLASEGGFGKSLADAERRVNQ